ncbi:MAG: hypothetical protein U0L09_06990 [Christensenellales bacterium]|nr:hypothetical protein [Christensenellales bacterium]
MKTSWKDLDIKEKRLYIVEMVIVAIGLVCTFADFSGRCEHADIGWMLCVAVMLAIECKRSWKGNRNMAILMIVAGVVMLVSGFAGKLI